MERHVAPVQDCLAMAPRDLDECPVRPALHPSGVLHSHSDVGQKRLQHSGRREVIGRPDLPRVFPDCFLAFRTGNTEAAHHALDIGEVVIANPGEREIGSLIVFRQAVEGDGIASGADRPAMGETSAFRASGRAGCVKDDAGIVRGAHGDLLVEPKVAGRIGGEVMAARVDHLIQRVEACVIVVAQASGLVVDDLFQGREVGRDGQNFVDLLVVLHDGEADIGVFEDELHLVRDRVGVDRDRDAAEHLHGGEGPVEPGTIGTDDGTGVASLQTQAGEAGRVGTNDRPEFGPGGGLPDPAILVAVGWECAMAHDVVQQKPGKRGVPIGGREGSLGGVPSPCFRHVLYGALWLLWGVMVVARC